MIPDDRRARLIEAMAEADLAQSRFDHRMSQACLVFGIEHQEAATASADELAADGAILAAKRVPVINNGVGCVPRPLFLVFPLGIEQVRETRQVA